MRLKLGMPAVRVKMCKSRLAWGNDNSGNVEYALPDELIGFPNPQVIAHPPAMNDGDPLMTIGENGQAAAVWLQVDEPVAREQAIEAQSLTPGATPIQIAVHRPLPH